ncbi:MAG: nucleotide exchange factor GrpE, partial [Piscirickettsiaceae bacterium]
MGSDNQTDQDVEQQETAAVDATIIDEVIDDVVEGEVMEPVALQAELDAANARADENWQKVLLAKADVE